MQGLVKHPESLREQAIRADNASTTGILLPELWIQLTTGRRRILDWFLTSERCLCVLKYDQKPTRRALAPELLETFETVLLGRAQKCVAADAELAASTVAIRCKAVMRYLDVEGTCSRVPLPLVVLVHARRDAKSLQVGRCSALRFGDDDMTVVSFSRPDLRLSEVLSPSEGLVAALCMEGRSYAQMAGLRGTSRRTIANQLGAVFRKLHLSGRIELMAWLAGTGATPFDAPGKPELLLLDG